MIVKNEEQVLRDCLESIKGIDETIICDTGSTDNTVNIAKEYTDKVFTDYKWNDNFAEARNHSLSKCKGDWVFIIDADEKLLTGVDKLKQTVNNANGDSVLNIKCKGGKVSYWGPRLFKNNDGIKWCGAIHNYLNRTSQAKTDNVLEFGYSPAHKKDPDRALRILRKEVENNYNLVREKYYLAREYYYRGNWMLAIVWFDEYLKVAHWAPEMADALLLKAICHKNLKDYNAAHHACLQAISINADFKEALLLMGTLCGPKNSLIWNRFAESAENNDVLFIRTEV